MGSTLLENFLNNVSHRKNMGVDQKILKFYARRDIQQEIVSLAKHREVAVKFGDNGFGKRPDILQYESDIREFALQGATSFHLSEEHWHDPIQLRPGMSKKQLDELRRGWDLLLDIDCAFIEFSKIAAQLLIEALQFHNVHAIGLKFSGNKGFHIIVPASSFPPTVDNKNLHLLFPEGPRMIASYLSSLIKDQLASQILSLSTPKEITQATNIPQEKLFINNTFDPFSVIEVDTLLISSRHLFRSPYSINEKSGLVSVVIPPEKIKSFRPSSAKKENVDTVLSYLPQPEQEYEATQLLVQAFDDIRKHPVIPNEPQAQEKHHAKFAIKTRIPEELFPPCMKLLLQGVQQDGRKRAVFALTNFLRHMNYTFEEIEELLMKWNEKNYEPLRQGYIKAQLSWHKRSPQNVLPPNCTHDAYYVPMGVCKPDQFCPKIKNPANYSLLKMKLREETKKPRKKRSTK